MHVCKGNPNLLFGELVGICSFEPIDFKPEEDIENSYTEHVKNWLVKQPEECTQRDNLDVLYERQVKDYLIKANVKTIFGVQYTVTLLCEVRSRLSSRYRTQDFKIFSYYMTISKMIQKALGVR